MRELAFTSAARESEHQPRLIGYPPYLGGALLINHSSREVLKSGASHYPSVQRSSTSNFVRAGHPQANAQSLIEFGPCRQLLLPLKKSGGYRGPACQVIRLSWPVISSAKPLYVSWAEKRLAVALSRPRLTHRAIEAATPTADQPPETNRYFCAGDLPMYISFMARPTCSTSRPKKRASVPASSCAPSSLSKAST